LLTLQLMQDHPGRLFELFRGTQVRARQTNNFIVTFERMKRHRETTPEEWADHTQTGTHINF